MSSGSDPWQRWQRERQRRVLHLPTYRPAAVLVGLTLEPQPRVLLTVRASTLPTHQGQISFPGGSLEAGETPVQAALREAWEEVGLQGSVEVLGELDDVFTPAGFHVTPVLARLPSDLTFTLSTEVDRVLLPPLSELRALEEVHMQRVGPDGVAFTLHRYPWRQHEIWGMTGRVIHSLLSSGITDELDFPAPPQL